MLKLLETKGKVKMLKAVREKDTLHSEEKDKNCFFKDLKEKIWSTQKVSIFIPVKISFKSLGKNTDAFGQTKAKRINSQLSCAIRNIKGSFSGRRYMIPEKNLYL